MQYEKQNFYSGQKLLASHLNHIEDGIDNISTEVNKSTQEANKNTETIASLSKDVSKLKKDIPTVPSFLPNPNALTIKIGSTTVTYDGSSAKTVEIADGTEVSY